MSASIAVLVDIMPDYFRNKMLKALLRPYYHFNLPRRLTWLLCYRANLEWQLGPGCLSHHSHGILSPQHLLEAMRLLLPLHNCASARPQRRCLLKMPHVHFLTNEPHDESHGLLYGCKGWCMVWLSQGYCLGCSWWLGQLNSIWDLLPCGRLVQARHIPLRATRGQESIHLGLSGCCALLGAPHSGVARQHLLEAGQVFDGSGQPFLGS